MNASGPLNRSSPPGTQNSLQRIGSNTSTTSPPHVAIGAKSIATSSQVANPPPPSYHALPTIATFHSNLDRLEELDPSLFTTAGTAKILIRRLPKNTNSNALRTMLLFAKDLVFSEIVSNEYPEDAAFATAAAYFQSVGGANEAMAMLDGKQNSTNDAKMIVEMSSQSPPGSLGPRRNTLDTSIRGTASSMSSNSSSGQLARQSSRFNGTFQSMERLSPPSTNGVPANGDFSSHENTSQMHSIFGPQSPIGSSVHERSRSGQPRVSGKSMIDQDGDEEETSELLRDPVAYARNGPSNQNLHTSHNAHNSVPLPRRSTNSQVPLSRFAGLSLSTNNLNNVNSPPMLGYASPRSAVGQTPSNNAMSPVGNMGPNTGYQMMNQHYPRHNFPPVNPADQNPPCNTLYVGNLPIDTSEDELKAMFSKQRGYKRLCFRTKQNGPMCFVEFEDISFATKALNELYGVSLHNSVKGGIRLSFSKNPLGVRTGQPGGMNSSTPLTPQGPFSGAGGNFGSQTGPGFSTANGPPPGLSAPPGLSMPLGLHSAGMNSANGAPNNVAMNNGYTNNSIGVANGGMNMSGMRPLPLGGAFSSPAAGVGMNSMAASYPDYMLGR